MKKKVVDPRFARKNKEYRGVIEAIAQEGMCPFCPSNFKYHKNPILKGTGSWFITRSSWPYKNSAHHFLIMTTRHKEQFKELSTDDWQKIVSLVNWAVKKFKLKGGGMAMRFGDTAYTGATVCHLHVHLIVPELKNGRARTVMFPIG